MEQSSSRTKTQAQLVVEGFHRLNAKYGNLPPEKMDVLLRTYPVSDLQLLSRHDKTSKASRARIKRIIEQTLMIRKELLSEGGGGIPD